MDIKRAISGLLLSFIFLLFFAYMIAGTEWIFSLDKKEDLVLNSTISDIIIENSTAAIVPSVETIDINAKSAFSINSNALGINKILFEKNSQTILPIASLTKLMTAIIVLDNYDLSQKITISEKANSQLSVDNDVDIGYVLPINFFLEIMIIESSNKSAYALADFIGEENFVELMNNKAKKIGLSKTFFVDPTGISPDNVSTANELAILAEYILKNYPEISRISKLKELFVPGFGIAKNTDQLLEEFPEIILGKTGFTNEAKGCLLLIMENKKDNSHFINIILGSEDRFLEMKKIINWLNNHND